MQWYGVWVSMECIYIYPIKLPFNPHKITMFLGVFWCQKKTSPFPGPFVIKLHRTSEGPGLAYMDYIYIPSGKLTKS